MELRLDNHRGGGKFGDFDGRSHVCEQASHRDDVPHARNVFQFDALACEQRRSHGGQRGILRATDAHGSFEWPSTFDQ
jgi:hypothetical protein